MRGSQYFLFVGLFMAILGIVGTAPFLTQSSPSDPQQEMRQLFMKYRLDCRLIQEMELQPGITMDDMVIMAAQQRAAGYDQEAQRLFGCEAIDLYLKLDQEQRAIVLEQLNLMVGRIK